jgi:acetamidase/formamidase
VHYEWNNAIAPRLEIDPGDTVVFETRDASDEFFSPRSTHET